MSIFIIYSSYKVITLGRLPIIGTFRSFGATKKAVASILLLESLFYGCMGGLIDIPVGILVLKAILQGMGIVLFAVSALLPHSASGNMLYLAGGFSLLGLIAATILVIPIFTNIVGAVLERFYGAIAGNEGRIAARNMKDNKNITQNITLLFISISAIIAISVVGNFVTAYISDVFHGAELPLLCQSLRAVT